MKMLFEESSQVLGGRIRVTSREPTFETGKDQKQGKNRERSRTQSKHPALPSGTHQHASSIATYLRHFSVSRATREPENKLNQM